MRFIRPQFLNGSGHTYFVAFNSGCIIPTTHSSAEHDRVGRITRRSNNPLRYVIVEGLKCLFSDHVCRTFCKSGEQVA